MSVIAVYRDKYCTDVYNSEGRNIFHYGGSHEGAYSSGNSVVIDVSESQGCMIQFSFDDDGNVINTTTLPGRRTY